MNIPRLVLGLRYRGSSPLLIVLIATLSLWAIPVAAQPDRIVFALLAGTLHTEQDPAYPYRPAVATVAGVRHVASPFGMFAAVDATVAAEFELFLGTRAGIMADVHGRPRLFVVAGQAGFMASWQERSLYYGVGTGIALGWFALEGRLIIDTRYSGGTAFGIFVGYER